MPVSNNDKFAIIDELQNTRTKGTRLMISLLFSGRQTEAAAVRKQVKTLGAAIDVLLVEFMKQWAGSGKAIVLEMKKTNQRLQRDINAIKKKKETANTVVNAVGRLDEVIVWAKDILAKI